jgi:chemosensory pili system protein ChpA (sensor histidine kinase/response regulator)
MQELVSESLHIVGEELAVTFNDVRLSLEQFAEGDRGTQSLDRCLNLLRTAIGVLRVTETYGASLLTEEMEATCRFLSTLPRTDSASDEAMEALSRAAVQLPTYVDRIINGGRDIPLVLLPLLNDLRAARGKPLLSESTLLLLNTGEPEGQQAQIESRTVSGEDVAQLCRELRPTFQLALLSWIKGGEAGNSLDKIAEVAARLESAAKSTELYQLWWVVGGITEALNGAGLETGVSLKRLMGQVDREMKRLISVGEDKYAESSPTELINNLLYYIARSTSTGPRVEGIRSAFNLSNLIPTDDQVEQVRESLAAPSVKLMGTVADAIRDDLARVKDILDIYVRTGMDNVQELEPQIELLKKISDTMGVLGLGALRESVEEKRLALQRIIEQGGPIEEELLMEMAAALLSVEDHLEEQLFGLIRPSAGEEGGEETGEAVDNDFQVVAQAVMREAIVNLAHVKDAVTQMLENPEGTSSLDSVPQNLRGITAGLLIIEKNEAVAVVDEIGEVIGEMIRAGRSAGEQQQFDLLADAIVSLEYYMETLQAGRKEPAYMLDNARGCLSALREGSTQAVLEVLERDPTAPEPEGKDRTYDSTVISLIRPVDPDAPTVAIQLGSGGEERVSPEIIELFIEEAAEEIENLKSLYPEWAQDENDQETLKKIRRSIHTLKGSGRVVGAALMGEFCWSLENLLNRLINVTLRRTPDIVDFLGRAMGALPELLEQLEVGTSPKIDVQKLMIEAQEFTTGRIAVAEPAKEPGETEHSTAGDGAEDDELIIEPEKADAPSGPEIDPVLLEILTKETVAHLSVIERFIADCREGAPPFIIPEELHRACHTLHGSVTMAKAEPAAIITGPLNKLIRHAFDHGVGVDKSVVSACADASRAVGLIVEHLSDSDGAPLDFSELKQRLLDIDATVEAQAAKEQAAAQIEDNMAFTTDIDDEISPPPAADAGGSEFDTEVAGIFAEEAGELLEGIDDILVKSADRRVDAAALVELQRILHTFKGGARMAGLLPMGDLSHDLETLLMKMADGQLAQDAPRLTVLRDTVDELHRLAEKVEQGAVEAPTALVWARLRDALTEGEEKAERVEQVEAPGAEPEAAPETVEPETVEEPEAPVLEETHLGRLARELREPPKPQTGDLTSLVRTPPPEAPPPADRRDFTRIDPGVLEQLLNNAGEVSISQSRLSQQMGQVQFSLDELGQTVLRLKEQLRGMEIATEAQILYQHRTDLPGPEKSADPLQLERYSKIQQLTRALSETANDVSSLKDLLQSLTADTEALLVQQARTAGELQDGLMRTRMVPFQQHGARLARLVRQMAAEHGKQAELTLQGGGDIDRQVLEKMLSPLEHMLRNAVIHGIETPSKRKRSKKPEAGKVLINVRREGSQVVIEINDDGQGMNVNSIRAKAVELGLAGANDEISDEEVLQYVFRPGFSTADRLTQASGRGIGMDIVASEVAKLGGALRIDTRENEGTRISVRLPFTLAVTQALIVRAAKEFYALPLPTVEGIIRISSAEFAKKMSEDSPSIVYGDQTFRLRHLGQFLGLGPAVIPEDEDRISIILVRAGNDSTALVTDEMLDSREIIVKPTGKQLAPIRGISGATILGDGQVAIILDAGALVSTAVRAIKPVEIAPVEVAEKPLALVVDDSITMRRVSQRLLERNGMRVVTAKDGLEAVGVLRDHHPDIILLDVEMPRMDGYEFASFVRNNEGTEDVPIIMITSRVSDEHKARAIELGVNDYLGKPYQETVLLDAVLQLLKTD